MAFKDMFSRNRKALDAPEGDGVSPVASELAGNDATKKKQQMMLAGVAAVALVGASFYIFDGGDAKPETADTAE